MPIDPPTDLQPHRSHAARRQLAAKVADGQFRQEDFDAIDALTNLTTLPERAGDLQDQNPQAYHRTARRKLY